MLVECLQSSYLLGTIICRLLGKVGRSLCIFLSFLLLPLQFLAMIYLSLDDRIDSSTNHHKSSCQGGVAIGKTDASHLSISHGRRLLRPVVLQFGKNDTKRNLCSRKRLDNGSISLRYRLASNDIGINRFLPYCSSLQYHIVGNHCGGKRNDLTLILDDEIHDSGEKAKRQRRR